MESSAGFSIALQVYCLSVWDFFLKSKGSLTSWIQTLIKNWGWELNLFFWFVCEFLMLVFCNEHHVKAESLKLLQ